MNRTWVQLKFARQIYVNASNTKFDENPLSRFVHEICGRKDVIKFIYISQGQYAVILQRCFNPCDYVSSHDIRVGETDSTQVTEHKLSWEEDHESWVGKNLKGGSHGLFQGTNMAFT